jgi:hypothetical protein
MNRNYIIIIAGIILISGFLGMSPNPEDKILGEWTEVKWEYEKINNKDFLDYDISKIKRHESEHWVFLPDKTLLMKKGNEVISTAEWRIKGRGHILKITHEDGFQELYDIKELDSGELIVNFDIGMETKGIARLHFEKTKSSITEKNS